MLLVGVGSLGVGCAEARLRVDDELVPVRLDGVSWSEADDGRLRGVLRLESTDFPDDRWLVNLHLPATAPQERGVFDVTQLPFGSRVFLLDPHATEVRARIGDVQVGQRGGGRIDAIFGGGPGEETLGVSVDWTRWQVDDRRTFGVRDDDDVIAPE